MRARAWRTDTSAPRDHTSWASAARPSASNLQGYSFRILYFDFRICFGFRYSDFGFCYSIEVEEFVGIQHQEAVVLQRLLLGELVVGPSLQDKYEILLDL